MDHPGGRQGPSFPGSGRMVPEIGDPAIRESIVYSYRVISRVLDEEIHILTIHHGARQLNTSDAGVDPGEELT